MIDKYYGLWHINSLPPDQKEDIEAMWWFDEKLYEQNRECFPNGFNSVFKNLKKSGVLDDILSCEKEDDCLVVNFKDLSQGCLFIMKLNEYLYSSRRKYQEQ